MALNWKRQEVDPTRTITDMDYTDDIALLVSTPAQDKYQLHSLKQATGSISLCMNTDKTEYMCFNQRVDISALKGGSLKLVEKSTYLMTRNDIDSYW